MITRKEFLQTMEEIYKTNAKMKDTYKSDFFYEDEDGSIVLIGSDLSEISFQFDENGNLCWFE